MRLWTNSIADGPHDRDPCPIWGGVITNDMLLLFWSISPKKKLPVWSSINNGWLTIPSTQNPSPWCKVPRWVPCSLERIGLGKGGGFCLGVLVLFFWKFLQVEQTIRIQSDMSCLNGDEWLWLIGYLEDIWMTIDNTQRLFAWFMTWSPCLILSIGQTSKFVKVYTCDKQDMSRFTSPWHLWFSSCWLTVVTCCDNTQFSSSHHKIASQQPGIRLSTD